MVQHLFKFQTRQLYIIHDKILILQEAEVELEVEVVAEVVAEVVVEAEVFEVDLVQEDVDEVEVEVELAAEELVEDVDVEFIQCEVVVE